AGGGHRRPGLRASVVAGGILALVRFKEIDDPAGTVDQRLPYLGVCDGNRCAVLHTRTGGGTGGRTRRRAGRRVSSAAGGRHEGEGRGRTQVNQAGLHLVEVSLIFQSDGDNRYGPRLRPRLAT